MTAGSGRLPDFVIIGAMKAGSTTLFRRIGDHPAASLPETKEPSFFCSEAVYARGLDWYRGLFPSGSAVTGESSVAYSDPDWAAVVAERLERAAPRVRLVFLARHPVERLRSHFLHASLRGRETRRLSSALEDSANPYVRRSMYARSIEPFLDRFPREQLLVVRSELLDDPGVWRSIQTFLGLTPEVQLDPTHHNISASKGRETAGMQVLRRTGSLGLAERLPRPIRRLGRHLVVRHDTAELHMRVDAAEGVIPDATVEALAADAVDFARLVRWPQVPWDLGSAAY